VCLIVAHALEAATRKGQVQRLWNLDSNTCDVLLETLINVHFLRQTPNGSYIRRDNGPCLARPRP